MATLPRTSKHGTIISTAFSTSPRALQEMSSPAQDGLGDVTAASGISMKQFEEQLSGLKKENFHLKLRIYFLEEKLGTGSPPAVQGLLEHNVRLQVEVEELRRQLTDKQELLAVAAEAIDVLGNQGSVSTDSIENSLNHSNAQGSQNIRRPEAVNETCAESESAGDYLGVTKSNDDLDDMMKLRRENRKALQMIKGCMKKIQQQDKEIKKLKLDKELVYAHVSDSQLEKFEEFLKCKDEHIKDLESKIRELQKNVDNEQDNSAGNLQELLTRRLQGLAFFLDKLLSHKCVLSEEKKKLAESILEQSLALPVGLQLDESIAPEEFTLDESNFDISQSMRMEDLTAMFGHHGLCSDDNNRHHAYKKSLRMLPHTDLPSESECWSEPDRNVSLARIGLNDAKLATRESTSDNNRHRARRSRVSYGSRSEEKPSNEAAFLEEISRLTKQYEDLEFEKNDIHNQLDLAKSQISDLLAEKEELKSILASESLKLIEADKESIALKNTILSLECKVKDVETQLADAIQIRDKLRSERQELESTFLETERSLRRAADDATVQASQAALERARAQHDRLRIEKDLEDTREELAKASETIANLEKEITRKVAIEACNRVIDVAHEEEEEEEERPTSPDQGIDSDRLSSLEQNDAISLSPRSLYEENLSLKQKLARTKATLADTLAQLNAANMRKRSVQRAICREIHKTQGVLRQARDHLEHPN